MLRIPQLFLSSFAPWGSNLGRTLRPNKLQEQRPLSSQLPENLPPPSFSLPASTVNQVRVSYLSATLVEPVYIFLVGMTGGQASVVIIGSLRVLCKGVGIPQGRA